MAETRIIAAWHNSPTTAIRRGVVVRPGYDCRVLCEHGEKGDHGVATTEVLYAVAVPDFALAIEVTSDVWPATAVRHTPAHELGWRRSLARASGTCLSEHRSEAIHDAEVADGIGPARPCALLEGGLCFFDGGERYTAAGAFYERHGSPRFDREREVGDPAQQSESFWLALEAVFTQRHDEHLQRRRERKRRCPTCAGHGVVP